jgi:type IV pilus assembly protein PilA
MAVNWFYADARNQQQGPVDAAWLASACRDGKVTIATLVWNENLTGWVPLAQVAAQLGIVVAAAAPPPVQAARGRLVASRPASSSSLWIVVAVVLFALVAFIGILAAIALPAYQDFTVRAKVAEAFVQADGLKVPVAELLESQKRCPRNGDAGIDAADNYATRTVAKIDVGSLGGDDECGINVTFADNTPRAIAGKHFTWSMDTEGKWIFHTDLDSRYLPRSLRTSSKP